MKPKMSLIILTLTLITTSALYSCAEKSEPIESVSKSEIVVGILDDLSGPFAGSAQDYVEAELDALRQINESEGGVLEHPVRAVVIDFKMDGALAMTGWDKLISEGVPVVYSLAAGIVPVIASSCDEDRVPLIASGGTVDQLFPTGESYYFSTNPHYYGIYDSILKQFQQDWSKKGKSGTPKIGFDVISFGAHGKVLAKIARMAAEKRGWEYIITVTPTAPADVTTQVLQMKQFQCDYVYITGTEAAAITWVKELGRQLDFKPQLVGGASTCASQELFNACGDLVEGVIFTQYNPVWTDTDVPFVSMLHELNAKWHPEKPYRASYYLRGYSFSLVVAEALKRAIENAGIENLNGIAMRETLEAFQGFDPMGIGAGFTWTPTDRQGIHGCVWYTWTKDGKQVRASEWDDFDPMPMDQRTQAFWLSD